MDLLVLGRRHAFRWFRPSLIGIECRVDGILLCQEVSPLWLLTYVERGTD